MQLFAFGKFAILLCPLYLIAFTKCGEGLSRYKNKGKSRARDRRGCGTLYIF